MLRVGQKVLGQHSGRMGSSAVGMAEKLPLEAGYSLFSYNSSTSSSPSPSTYVLEPQHWMQPG